MRIAILGAGFSGLATAWHLLQYQSLKNPLELVVFDPKGVGGGASGIAAGLMHPYAGAHAKLNLQAQEGMQATFKLLNIATQALGAAVAESSGLLRMAISDDQKRDFLACAAKHDDVQLCSPEECRSLIPEIIASEGILIKSAVTVNSERYLEGLWLACSLRQAKLEKRAINSLSELADFDVIIVAMGAATTSLAELKDLPIRATKGQIIECQWPKHVPALPMPVNSQAYIVMNPGNASCIVGATYERHYSSADPQFNSALEELQEKAWQLLPSLKHAQISKHRAGLRASAPNHQPFIKKINQKCWVICGMGSKGLLYHALYAEKLSAEIFAVG